VFRQKSFSPLDTGIGQTFSGFSFRESPVYASAQIDIEKNRREVNSRSNTTTSSGSAGVNGSVTLGVPVAGPSITIGGDAGVTGGSEKGTATEKGPLAQKETDDLWKKYYDRAYADPQIAGYGPNVLCMRNEKDCLTSSGQTPRPWAQCSPRQHRRRGNHQNSQDSVRIMQKKIWLDSYQAALFSLHSHNHPYHQYF
jgi:hypothetical protein